MPNDDENKCSKFFATLYGGCCCTSFLYRYKQLADIFFRYSALEYIFFVNRFVVVDAPLPSR